LDDTVSGRVILTSLLCDTAVSAVTGQSAQSYVRLCYVHIAC